MRRLGVAIAVLAAWVADRHRRRPAGAAGPPGVQARPDRLPRLHHPGGRCTSTSTPFAGAWPELGLADGTDVVLTARYAAGRYDRLTALAADLVRSKVDVLVTPGSEATVAATRATSTVPIVMLEVGDPVVHGLVASLRPPGR